MHIHKREEKAHTERGSKGTRGRGMGKRALQIVGVPMVETQITEWQPKQIMDN